MTSEQVYWKSLNLAEARNTMTASYVQGTMNELINHINFLSNRCNIDPELIKLNKKLKMYVASKRDIIINKPLEDTDYRM